MKMNERNPRLPLIAFAMVCSFLAMSCSSLAASPQYPVFGPEEEVFIENYALDAMEPFLARDGQTLFYNSLNNGTDTTLYSAAMIGDTRFSNMGPLDGANGAVPHLDAVASMDGAGNFYFVSTRNYPAVYENLQRGVYSGGAVSNASPVTGDFYIRQSGWIVMDAEIAPDGETLYYVNARFAGNPLPEESRLGVARRNGIGFLKLTASDEWFKNVNGALDKVYAPSTTADGLTLFFTRIKWLASDSEICVSVRAAANEAFSSPQKIDMSGHTPEAVTVSADGCRIYYHKKTAPGGPYRIYTRKRL